MRDLSCHLHRLHQAEMPEPQLCQPAAARTKALLVLLAYSQPTSHSCAGCCGLEHTYLLLSAPAELLRQAFQPDPAAVQSTLRSPSIPKMKKATYAAYVFFIAVFFMPAVAGYWAFGNSARPLLPSLQHNEAAGRSMLSPASSCIMRTCHKRAYIAWLGGCTCDT